MREEETARALILQAPKPSVKSRSPVTSPVDTFEVSAIPISAAL
jgi:hypothetical protein